MTLPWRLIEAELVAWAKLDGQTLDDNALGDKLITFSRGWDGSVNLTDLAKHLSISLVPRTVTVKANDPV